MALSCTDLIYYLLYVSGLFNLPLNLLQPVLLEQRSNVADLAFEVLADLRVDAPQFI